MQKNSIILEFPIYYTQKFKTKKDKKLLVGLNNYRNWHHYLSNAIKIYYHDLTKSKIGKNKFIKVKMHYKVYVARGGTDGPNIRSIMEKFILDGLVECGALQDDSIEFLIGDTSEYFIDKSNPRFIVEIEEII